MSLMAAENTSPANAKSARCEASEAIDICNYRTEKIEAEGGMRPGLISSLKSRRVRRPRAAFFLSYGVG
jgi:hypothetical protein